MVGKFLQARGMQRYYGNLKLGALRMLCTAWRHREFRAHACMPGLFRARACMHEKTSKIPTRFPLPSPAFPSHFPDRKTPITRYNYGKRKENLGCSTALSRGCAPHALDWCHAQPSIPGGLRTVSVTVTLNFFIHTLNAALMSACSRWD